jgi:hypothetical protein
MELVTKEDNSKDFYKEVLYSNGTKEINSTIKWMKCEDERYVISTKLRGTDMRSETIYF